MLLFDIDTNMHNAGQHTKLSIMTLTTTNAPVAYNKATFKEQVAYKVQPVAKLT